jgi:hypothetical protein
VPVVVLDAGESFEFLSFCPTTSYFSFEGIIIFYIVSVTRVSKNSVLFAVYFFNMALQYYNLDDARLVPLMETGKLRSLATWFRCLFMNEMFPR